MFINKSAILIYAMLTHLRVTVIPINNFGNSVLFVKMFVNKSVLFLIIIGINHFGIVQLHLPPVLKYWKYFGSERNPGPIDITTKDAKFVKRSPLRVTAIASEIWRLNNTGRSIEVHVDQLFTRASITGGILNNDVYKFSYFRYYWHKNDTNERYAYSTVNGKEGTQIEVLVYFYNARYGTFKNALNHSDGLLSLSCRANVVCTTQNPLYFPFQQIFKKIKHVGETSLLYNEISWAWLGNYPCDVAYYAYPGSYTDELTGKTYYSTVIVLDLVPMNFISHDQFEDTFGSLKDCSGRSFINAVKQHPQGSIPIIKSQGFELENIIR